MDWAEAAVGLAGLGVGALGLLFAFVERRASVRTELFRARLDLAQSVVRELLNCNKEIVLFAEKRLDGGQWREHLGKAMRAIDALHEEKLLMAVALPQKVIELVQAHLKACAAALEDVIQCDKVAVAEGEEATRAAVDGARGQAKLVEDGLRYSLLLVIMQIRQDLGLSRVSSELDEWLAIRANSAVRA